MAHKEEATSSGTVARVALLLRVLAEAPGESTLGEIAGRMKLPVSTTHRLLNLLLDQGFVERGQDSRSYRCGLEFLRIGGLVSSRAQLTDVAEPFMRTVVAECDETCLLSVFMPHNRSSMIAKVVYGSHPLRYVATLYQPQFAGLGSHRPGHPGLPAAGRDPGRRRARRPVASDRQGGACGRRCGVTWPPSGSAAMPARAARRSQARWASRRRCSTRTAWWPHCASPCPIHASRTAWNRAWPRCCASRPRRFSATLGWRADAA